MRTTVMDITSPIEERIHGNLKEHLKADWARDLENAMDLISVFGECTLLMERPKITESQLARDEGRLDDLILNLCKLTRQGQKTFLQVSRDTHAIAQKSYHLVKKNGLIDIIATGSNRGPEGKAMTAAALQVLEAQLEKSVKEGEKTQELLNAWESSIEELQDTAEGEKKGARKKKVEASNEAEKHEKKKNEHERAREANENKLNEVREDLRKAEAALESSKADAKFLHDCTGRVNDYVRETTATEGFSFSKYLFAPVVMVGGAAIGASLSNYQKAKEERVNACKKDFDEARMKYEKYEQELNENETKTNLENAKESLDSANSEAETWDAVSEIAESVATLMKRIHRSVGHVKTYSETMGDSVRSLSTAYEMDFKFSKQGQQDEKDDSEHWKPVLQNTSIEFRSHAYILHALSAVFAWVSKNYIKEGFSLIASFQYQDDDEKDLPSSELEGRRRGQLKAFVKNAKAGIRERVYEEKVKLFNEAMILYPELTPTSPLYPKRDGA